MNPATAIQVFIYASGTEAMYISIEMFSFKPRLVTNFNG